MTQTTHSDHARHTRASAALRRKIFDDTRSKFIVGPLVSGERGWRDRHGIAFRTASFTKSLSVKIPTIL